MSIEEYLCYSGAAIIVVAIIVVLYRRMHPKMKHGEILPADVMKAKYNLTAEHYKPPRLNPERVPHRLRDLLPIAAKWGIGDDIIRDDFQQRAPESEKQELGELIYLSRVMIPQTRRCGLAFPLVQHLHEPCSVSELLAVK
jgi:hypothetical protein